MNLSFVKAICEFGRMNDKKKGKSLQYNDHLMAMKENTKNAHKKINKNTNKKKENAKILFIIWLLIKVWNLFKLHVNPIAHQFLFSYYIFPFVIWPHPDHGIRE